MANLFPSNYGTMQTSPVVPTNQQVVIPQITIPQPVQMPMPVLQGPQLHRVKGLDGAKQFPTQANAMYALFDEDDDIMYVKVTDQNNYPVSLKRYRFIEEAEPVPAPPPEYVTMEEFKKFKEEMLNAKQPVRYDAKPGYNSGKSNYSKPASSESST